MVKDLSDTVAGETQVLIGDEYCCPLCHSLLLKHGLVWFSVETEPNRCQPPTCLRRGTGGDRDPRSWGKTLHCNHLDDPCIKTGSDESRYNVSFILRDKVLF